VALLVGTACSTTDDGAATEPSTSMVEARSDPEVLVDLDVDLGVSPPLTSSNQELERTA